MFSCTPHPRGAVGSSRSGWSFRKDATRRTDPQITWTAQLTYTAGGLTSDDIDALTDALGDGGIVYGSDTGRLQITLEVEAPTLQDAADTVLRMTAAATGLLKLTRLHALTTAEFVAEIEHPPAMNLDVIGVTEIAAELGVSRQRAGHLTRTFPNRYCTRHLVASTPELRSKRSTSTGRPPKPPGRWRRRPAAARSATWTTR